ncbi:MAG: nuclear transport factor 2 family protein [Pseudomonadota bacterium]
MGTPDIAPDTVHRGLHAELVSLVVRSFWLVDHGRAAEVAGFFAQDGLLTFGPGAPKPGALRGPEIAAAMQARQDDAAATSRHVLSNFLVEPQADGRVEVRSLMTLFRTATGDFSPTVRSVADLVDTFVLQDGSWRIVDRQILPIFGLA